MKEIRVHANGLEEKITDLFEERQRELERSENAKNVNKLARALNWVSSLVIVFIIAQGDINNGEIKLPLTSIEFTQPFIIYICFLIYWGWLYFRYNQANSSYLANIFREYYDSDSEKFAFADEIDEICQYLESYLGLELVSYWRVDFVGHQFGFYLTMPNLDKEDMEKLIESDKYKVVRFPSKSSDFINSGNQVIHISASAFRVTKRLFNKMIDRATINEPRVLDMALPSLLFLIGLISVSSNLLLPYMFEFWHLMRVFC
ncbi:MAG TPA: hypothetical protein VIM93_00425 [Kangiella sp.]